MTTLNSQGRRKFTNKTGGFNMEKQAVIELMNGYKLPLDKMKLVIEIDRLEKIDDEKRRLTGTFNSEICEKICILKMHKILTHWDIQLRKKYHIKIYC
jgi:hypothetical protein